MAAASPAGTSLIAYAATTHACEGATGLEVITGFDRYSVRSAPQQIAYVACSRGWDDIEVFVESVADLSQIQNRSGDRKAAVGMAFLAGSERSAGRAEAAFAVPAERVRAAKETVEHAQTVDLCRQAAQTLEPGKDRQHAADLQEHAICNAQETARRAEAHERHHGLEQTHKRQQGGSLGHGIGL